jgi:hypothetical protein
MSYDDGKRKTNKNMFDYLYYKLYKATLKGSLRDIPQFVTPVFLAGLVSVNLLVINALLAKIDVMPFLSSNRMRAVALTIVLSVLAFVYFKGERSNRLLKKYAAESKSQRIRGNVIVSIYVAVSVLSIFAVGFFRPGKL